MRLLKVEANPTSGDSLFEKEARVGERKGGSSSFILRVDAATWLRSLLLAFNAQGSSRI